MHKNVDRSQIDANVLLKHSQPAALCRTPVLISPSPARSIAALSELYQRRRCFMLSSRPICYVNNIPHSHSAAPVSTAAHKKDRAPTGGPRSTTSVQSEASLAIVDCHSTALLLTHTRRPRLRLVSDSPPGFAMCSCAALPTSPSGAPAAGWRPRIAAPVPAPVLGAFDVDFFIVFCSLGQDGNLVRPHLHHATAHRNILGLLSRRARRSHRCPASKAAAHGLPDMPICPSTPGSNTISASSRTAPGPASQSQPELASTLSFRAQSLRGLNSLFDRAHHVERRLRQIIVLAVQNLAEAAHRILDLHESARRGL